jgi:hypothetical protein
VKATKWEPIIIDSRPGLGIFLFTTASGTVLGPTQPPTRWVPGALYLGVKWQGCETDHSPLSSAKVKECVELCLHSQYAFLAWCSIKIIIIIIIISTKLKII